MTFPFKQVIKIYLSENYKKDTWRQSLQNVDVIGPHHWSRVISRCRLLSQDRALFFVHFSLFWHRVRFFLFSSIDNSLPQGGKEPLRIAYIKKKLSVSKATCPESIQIILWETLVTKSSRKVFKNVNLVRVLPLITNLASFFNNKI